MSYQELLALRGVGRDLAAKITEILLTGSLKALDDLQREGQPNLMTLLEVEGLGPKRVRQLVMQLGIQDLDDLEEAARAGHIRLLPGFGARSEQNILKSIEAYRKAAQRMPRAIAEELVRPLVSYLCQVKGVDQVIPAGSFRRCRDTVGDLDLLVTGNPESPVMEAFVNYPLCEKVLVNGPTRSSIRLKNGFDVDLRFVQPDQLGAALYYFTGSRAHILAVRTLARERGLKINEYGVFRGEKRVAGETEASVFHAVGLDFIPPVLRENRGEIQAAAQHRLPRLVTVEDLQGDLHAHTTASDGAQTLEEMVAGARAAGLKYLAITDHSQTTAQGLVPEQFNEHLQHIDAVRRNTPDLMLLRGVEVDILRDGQLDLPDPLLERMDWVVASVHAYFKLDEAQQTERLVRAIRHPYVNAIGHPMARRLPDRPSISVNWARIFDAARQTGTWLEINAQPTRMDLDDSLIAQAKQAGVKFVISTDAHHSRNFANLRYGVEMAQRGWLAPADVMNTLPPEAFLRALDAKRFSLGA
jgi:DNA polymerase (family 10)